MTKLKINEIMKWLTNNGEDPSNEELMYYIDNKEYQDQIDEAVKKDYHPADLDRWIILIKLFGEITYDTAMTISNALNEDEINPTDVYDLVLSDEERIKIQAVMDYDELVYKIRNFHGSFENLCIFLNGYNYTPYHGIFDCNYKTIRATIKHDFKNNYYEVCNDIDIWDDSHATMIKEQIQISELREEI